MVHDATANVGERVPESIESQSTRFVPHHFEGDETEKHGDREDDEIHNGKLIIPLCIGLMKGTVEFFTFAAHWRDGRVVDCGGLENRCTARYRGFESLSLR